MVVLVSPAFADHGGEHAPGGGFSEGFQSGAELLGVVRGVTNWLFAILLIFAVIYIVLATFQFLTGGGDPQAVAQARTKLIYAAIAVIVASLARAIPEVVSRIVGA